MATDDELAAKDALYFQQVELQATLRTLENESQKREAIHTFIRESAQNANVICPDFQQDAFWINTSEPLSLQHHFRNHVVVLDFFTYCCLNCLHILPNLSLLEQRYSKDLLTVIGVHSAKFANEKVERNVEKAVERHEINHAVVCDDGELWEKLEISCWPTVLILGPGNQLIFSLIGENVVHDWLDLFCEETLTYFGTTKAELEKPSKQLAKPRIYDHSFSLKFPGKISASLDGRRLAISDTGHHRIVIASAEGIVECIVGGKGVGLTDGDISKAAFNFPQGIVWRSDCTFFVADTGNHAIREVDLGTRRVVTIVGNGTQGSDITGGATSGRDQSLNSPWDVCLVQDDKLFIAMAGSHQIWVLILKEETRLMGKTFPKGVCFSFAGNGAEENRNNLYAHKAAFAQPSGLAYCASEGALLVADSESSTVRVINLTTGAVKALVGGTKDPLNLFAFGDKDGVGFDVRLQHPMAVAFNAVDNSVFVADAYNHKIKEVQLQSKECISVAGSGELGDRAGCTLLFAQFNEPNGLCLLPDINTLLVADTNNHCVKCIRLDKDEVSTLNLDWTAVTRKLRDDEIRLDQVSVSLRDQIEIELNVVFGKDHELTEEAPSVVDLQLPEKFPFVCLSKLRQTFETSSQPKFKLSPICENELFGEFLIECNVQLFLCKKSDGTCTMKKFTFRQPLLIESVEPSSREVVIRLTGLIE